jgi:hypothetical protein
VVVVSVVVVVPSIVTTSWFSPKSKLLLLHAFGVEALAVHVYGPGEEGLFTVTEMLTASPRESLLLAPFPSALAVIIESSNDTLQLLPSGEMMLGLPGEEKPSGISITTHPISGPCPWGIVFSILTV